MVAVSSWAVDAWLREQPEETRWPRFFGGLAERGIGRAEICHFHLPEDPAPVVKAAREEGVKLQTLLVDDGDLTHPTEAATWEEWIAAKLRLADRMGFERARVIAGKSVGPDALDRSIAAFLRLAENTDVRITTENWFPVLDSPAAVNELLDRTEGKVGLCADFGNWPNSRREADLPAILPRAETIHAKADFNDQGQLEEDAYRRLVALALDAGFAGPYVMVAGGWEGLEQSVAIVRGL